jgi:very-short-patch-repair endonuclease
MPLRNHNEFSRRLRREQTPEEKDLWKALRGRRFAGFKFRRQHEVAPYFLDFYCPLAKLAVELDGSGHGLSGQRGHDTERDTFLAAKGIEVLRLWNLEWSRNRKGCLLEIWAALTRRVPADELAKLDTASTRYLPPKESNIIRSSRGPR